MRDNDLLIEIECFYAVAFIWSDQLFYCYFDLACVMGFFPLLRRCCCICRNCVIMLTIESSVDN